MSDIRITQLDIDTLVLGSKIQFVRVPGTTVTVCCMTLPSGYSVVEHSACVDPENFDEELGQKIAAERATNKLWELEGYLLANRVAEQAARKEAP